ncbi:hypothetical protein C8Q77DRAFT_1153321 [Trametes polyzona]|nr:hypothetical protein C8Q77DRAFT_1153321 [Trametes polyzona]
MDSDKVKVWCIKCFEHRIAEELQCNSQKGHPLKSTEEIKPPTYQHLALEGTLFQARPGPSDQPWAWNQPTILKEDPHEGTGTRTPLKDLQEEAKEGDTQVEDHQEKKDHLEEVKVDPRVVEEGEEVGADHQVEEAPLGPLAREISLDKQTLVTKANCPTNCNLQSEFLTDLQLLFLNRPESKVKTTVNNGGNFGTWQQWVEDFCIIFGEIDPQGKASIKLTALKYDLKEDLFKFNSRFLDLCSKARIYDNHTQSTIYTSKLPGYLWDKIALTFPAPWNMDELMDRAIHLNRQWKINRELDVAQGRPNPHLPTSFYSNRTLSNWLR